MNPPFGFPHGCLPFTLITTRWSIIHCVLPLSCFFSLCLHPWDTYAFHISNYVYVQLFRCGKKHKTMQEVLVKWQIMTRLEETCLISSIEWWWFGATLPLCLALSSRCRKRKGTQKLFFIIPPTEEDFYSTMWMQNPLEIENGKVIPAKKKSIPWNKRESREQREKEAKTRQEIKALPCTSSWNTRAALHENWMIFTVFHRTEFTSPFVPWNVYMKYRSFIQGESRKSLYNMFLYYFLPTLFLSMMIRVYEVPLQCFWVREEPE